MALLEVRGLSVAIGGQPRLADIDLDLNEAEIVGLAGASGSGKSLLSLALAVLEPPTARVRGSVRLAGRDLRALPEPALEAVRGRELGLVFQEPATALNPLLTIGAQVAETVRLHAPGLSRAAIEQRVTAMLSRVGLEPQRVPGTRYPHQVSGGQRQRVALALASVMTPRLLIADEPTTALDVTTQAQVIALLRRMADDDGTAVLLVSHDLALLSGIADRLLILRDGRLVEQGATAQLLRAPQHPYTRTLLEAFALPAAARSSPRPGPPLLEARDVCRDVPATAPRLFARRRTRRIVEGVSFAIQPGERVALVGESGSGKSSLARLLLGLDRPSGGEIDVGGERLPAPPAAVPAALRRRVQAVFQDPAGSLNPRHRVARIVAEPLALLGTSKAERRERAASALAAVGLGADSLERWPHEFSGGERQRIALARALVIEPDLVVLDEALSALDAELRAQVLARLVELSEQRGLAFLLVTHDLAIVRAAAERVLVMQDGRIVERGTTADVLDHPQHPYTRRLVASTPRLGARLDPAAGDER